MSIYNLLIILSFVGTMSFKDGNRNVGQGNLPRLIDHHKLLDRSTAKPIRPQKNIKFNGNILYLGKIKAREKYLSRGWKYDRIPFNMEYRSLIEMTIFKGAAEAPAQLLLRSCADKPQKNIWSIRKILKFTNVLLMNSNVFFMKNKTFDVHG